MCENSKLNVKIVIHSCVLDVRGLQFYSFGFQTRKTKRVVKKCINGSGKQHSGTSGFVFHLWLKCMSEINQ